jgi:hypothetical protein
VPICIFDCWHLRHLRACTLVCRWGCTVAECVGQHPVHGPVWLLKYDEKEVEGKKFEAEERCVVFCTPELLVDVEAEEDGEGGEDDLPDLPSVSPSKRH